MRTASQHSDQEEPNPSAGGEIPQPDRSVNPDAVAIQVNTDFVPPPAKAYGEMLRETLTTAGRETRAVMLPARFTAEHPELVLPTEEEWAAAGRPPLLIRRWLPRSYGGTAT